MKVIEDLTGYILVADDTNGTPMWDSKDAVAAYESVWASFAGFWDAAKESSAIKCCEVVTGEYRFKACVDMPEHIVAYMDYVEPREEPQPAPVEMQYINRRDFMPDGTRGDGALWPTMFPITSPGWVQIGKRPIQAGYHSEDDTILVYSGHTPRPADKMTHVRYSGYFTNDKRIWTKNGQFNYANDMPDILAINFSKGDHLSAEEREAWHQEATGFQESYYQTFQK